MGTSGGNSGERPPRVSDTVKGALIGAVATIVAAIIAAVAGHSAGVVYIGALPSPSASAAASSSAPAEPSPASTTAPGGTVYLTQLSAVQDGQGYSVQPVQMDGKQYQQSFVMLCWPGASTNTPSMIYEATGYKTLSATVGIPDSASGA